MKVLPIVERELREGARRIGTYWLRTALVAFTMIAGIVMLFFGDIPVRTGRELGPILFWSLAGTALLFCLLAGRIFTADCLSREKREGTLGLLFLTDLKGYDVVLGKLAATSVPAFYALVATVPVLTVPLLAGGVSYGEVWRTALVLVDTFFLSLAAGLLASVLSREYRLAMAANFLLLFFTAFLAPMIGMMALIIKDRADALGFFYTCPIFALVRGEDTLYRRLPQDYWASLGIIHLLGWIMVVLACGIVPRAWRDRTDLAPAKKRRERWNWAEMKRWAAFGGREKQAAFRKWALDRNAYFWLASRERLKPAQVWIFIGVVLIWGLDAWYRGRILWRDPGFYLTVIVIVNLALKFWVAQEGVQRFGEDRSRGGFELLLPTPLSTNEMLAGQTLAMRRQFLKPILIVFVLELLCWWRVIQAQDNYYWKGGPAESMRVTALVEAMFLPLDVWALAWVGMFAGMTTRTASRGVVFATARVLLPPAVCYLLVSGLPDPFLRRLYFPGSIAAMWIGPGILADLCFGGYARWMLRRHFRYLALRPLPFLPKAAAAAG